MHVTFLWSVDRRPMAADALLRKVWCPALQPLRCGYDIIDAGAPKNVQPSAAIDYIVARRMFPAFASPHSVEIPAPDTTGPCTTGGLNLCSPPWLRPARMCVMEQRRPEQRLQASSVCV